MVISQSGVSSSVSKPSRLHLDYIDGLRALAALYVVSVHTFPRVWSDREPNGVFKILAKVLAQGHFAVSVFIVISGFCLMLPVLNNHLRLRGGIVRFFKKRAWRILPPFYIAFLLSLATLVFSLSDVKYPTQDLNAAFVGKTILSHLFVVNNIFEKISLPTNGVLWSIGVEWQIYLLFPTLLIAWQRFGGVKATILTIIGSYSLLFCLRGTFLAAFTAQYIALFALGMFGAAIAYDPNAEKWAVWRKQIPWKWIALSLFLTVALFCLGLGWQNASQYIPYLDLLIGLSSCCLLVAASKPNSHYIQKVLAFKPLVFIGSFSYSIYLIHYPLVTILCKYFFFPLHLNDLSLFLLLVFVGLPIILVASYLFFLGCELPFMRKARLL